MRMRRGLLSLLAGLDWYSRSVLAWARSNSLATSFCLAALEPAGAPGQPAIFDTDQGSPFTRLAYTTRMEQAGIQISWDGRGRALNHVFVAQIWRSVHRAARLLRPITPWCSVRRSSSCDARWWVQVPDSVRWGRDDQAGNGACLACDAHRTAPHCAANPRRYG